MSSDSNEPSKLRTEPDAIGQVTTGRLGAVGLQGHVDAIEAGRVYGWAWNPEAPDDQVSVDIHHKGALIGHAVANRFRQDLADLQMADGSHAFAFDLPSPLREADSMAIAVYFSDTQIPLSRGGSGDLPLPSADRDTVDLLSGRIDRMEASLQQVYRALHFFRNRDEDLSNTPKISELEFLRKELLDIKERTGLLAERFATLAGETNSTLSLVERIELEMQSGLPRREADERFKELTSRLTALSVAIILTIFALTISGYLAFGLI